MAILSRDALLSPSLRRETVDVPELGGQVVIRELTVDEQQLITTSSRGDAVAIAAKCVLEGCVEPKLEPADYDRLRQLSGSAVGRIAYHIMDLSGMTEEARNRIMGKSQKTQG